MNDLPQLLLLWVLGIPILTPVVTFLINGIVPRWNVFVAIVLIVCGSYLATYKNKEA